MIIQYFYFVIYNKIRALKQHDFRKLFERNCSERLYNVEYVELVTCLGS
jgi:hypothetical protein